MMEPEIKRAWVKALRSGKYEQGRTALCRDDQYCCLGVLYDIAFDGYWSYRHGRWYTDDHSATVLSEPQRRAVGLTYSHQGELIELNDGGDSFSQIADWIETNL